MTNEVTPELVQMASAVIDIADSQSGFLADDQKQAFRSLQSIRDTEEKAAATMAMMEQLTSAAKSSLESASNDAQQAAALTAELSPEAQRAVRDSASEYENRLRSDAQAELRALAPAPKPSATKRNRLRI